MELPDWGLDSEKKDEKVVELRRSVSDVLSSKDGRQVATSALALNVTKPLRFLETIADKRSEKEEQIAENVSVLLE